MNTTLHTATRGAISLQAALSALPADKLDELVGLLYSPRSCDLVRWYGGEARTAHETAETVVDLTQVYEARFFNDTLELRWLRDPLTAGLGQAACLSEETIDLDGWTVCPSGNLETIPGQYLLSGWGCNADGTPPGWSLLSNASVGKRLAPLAGVGPNQSAVLQYREYLGPAPGEAGATHGNWAILEERLLGLAPNAGDTK